MDRYRAADSGWFPITSRDGVPVYNAFAHVKLSGWAVGMGIPVDILFAPVRRSTLILMLVGVATVLVALVMASVIARRIARPIGELVTYAGVVGRGERLALHSTGIKETDAVARSLHQADEQLRRSAEARDRAADELRESEQKYRALAEDLAAANEERTQLLHRTVEAQEVERKRIARELHDSLGQYLTALRLGFDAIEPACATDATARRRLLELKDIAAELGRDFSRMAWELRPMALDDLGLRSAITHYLEEWAERSGLHIDLEITLGDRRLPAAVETALFRVLQEAITNVVKHSGGDRVGVILEATNGEVRLIVEDNGHGFQVDEGTTIALSRTHLGLLGVRERLALVNGRLDVRGDGTERARHVADLAGDAAWFLAQAHREMCRSGHRGAILVQIQAFGCAQDRQLAGCVLDPERAAFLRRTAPAATGHAPAAATLQPVSTAITCRAMPCASTSSRLLTTTMPA